MGETVKPRHFLKRLAEKHAKRLRRYDPGHRYRVEPIVRGFYRWRVVRLPGPRRVSS